MGNRYRKLGKFDGCTISASPGGTIYIEQEDGGTVVTSRAALHEMCHSVMEFFSKRSARKTVALKVGEILKEGDYFTDQDGGKIFVPPVLFGEPFDGSEPCFRFIGFKKEVPHGA